MTAEIIDLSEFRNKNSTDVPIGHDREKYPIMNEFMRGIIHTLMNNGYDPYDDLTSERMAILVTMFQSHLNYIDNGEEGLDLFGLVKEMIFYNDEDHYE